MWKGLVQDVHRKVIEILMKANVSLAFECEKSPVKGGGNVLAMSPGGAAAGPGGSVGGGAGPRRRDCACVEAKFEEGL